VLQQIVLSGLTIGAIYALIAVGFTIVFSTVRIVNFAHGEFVMAGAMFYAYLHAEHGVPVPGAIGLSIVLCVVVAWLVYVLGLAGMNQDNHIAQVMVTLGLGITVKGLVQVVLGKDIMFPPPFSLGAPEHILGVMVPLQTFWIAGALLLILVNLWLLFEYTRVGKGMGAVSINHYAATLMGISPQRAAIFAFAIAGLMGGIAGTLLAPVAAAQYDSGIFLGVKGFAAAILGGLGSPLGAVLGGLTLGLTEALAAGYLSSTYKDAVPLFLLLMILLLRPQGLIGKYLPQKF